MSIVSEAFVRWWSKQNGKSESFASDVVKWAECEQAFAQSKKKPGVVWTKLPDASNKKKKYKAANSEEWKLQITIPKVIDNVYYYVGVKLHCHRRDYKQRDVLGYKKTIENCWKHVGQPIVYYSDYRDDGLNTKIQSSIPIEKFEFPHETTTAGAAVTTSAAASTEKKEVTKNEKDTIVIDTYVFADNPGDVIINAENPLGLVYSWTIPKTTTTTTENSVSFSAVSK